MHSMELQRWSISPSRSLYVRSSPRAERGLQGVSLSTLYMLYRHCSRCPSYSTDKMLLRLIFISVNTGLSSALFAFLSVILVRLDMLLTLLFLNSRRPRSGSSSYSRPISSSQPSITHSARCTATPSWRASMRARSSEVAVRYSNSTRVRPSYGGIPSRRTCARTRARNGRRYRSSPLTSSAAHVYVFDWPPHDAPALR